MEETFRSINLKHLLFTCCASVTMIIFVQKDQERHSANILPVFTFYVKAAFLVNLLPFIGFGILDNLLMIVCGEYIDQTMGVLLGISTMAAAGLGNIISDIAGVGSAHYVEFLVSKFGINQPNLTPAQWASSKIRWTTNFGRCTGLVVGCLIGMFPLLFYDEKEKQEKKLHAKEN